MNNPSLEVLSRIESGLRAELGVLRATIVRDLNDDLLEEYEFHLEDAQLDELNQTKEFLQEQIQIVSGRLKKRIKEVSTLNTLKTCKKQAENEEAHLSTEEELKQEIQILRRRALKFAREQWPLTQDTDTFEGGDFWDASIAACKNQNKLIDYSDKESGFAELLLQSGIADRAEDYAGIKRIRFAKEIYEIEE